MTRAIRALIFLIPIVAWVPPAGAPEPTVDDVIQQQITRRAMELIQRSSARNAGGKPTAAMLASEAAAVKQAVDEALAKPAPAPLAAPPAPAMAIPAPAAAIPAPPPVVVTAPTEVSIPQEVKDLIVSFCSLLITAGLAAGLAWMRAHLAFMKEAAANQAVTAGANGFGALLEQELAKQGKSLSSVSISDPTVAAFAQKLLAAYPEWGPLVGLTPDVAERKVLAGALQQSTAPLVVAAVAPIPPPPPAPSPPPPAPPPSPPAPPSPATSPDLGVVTVTGQAVSPTAVPTPPPTDLEVHP